LFVQLSQELKRLNKLSSKIRTELVMVLVPVRSLVDLARIKIERIRLYFYSSKLALCGRCLCRSNPVQTRVVPFSRLKSIFVSFDGRPRNRPIGYELRRILQQWAWPAATRKVRDLRDGPSLLSAPSEWRKENRWIDRVTAIRR